VPTDSGIYVIETLVSDTSPDVDLTAFDCSSIIVAYCDSKPFDPQLCSVRELRLGASENRERLFVVEVSAV
tara:strand:+ start:7023 stop:7235 length:213 start_codon:yes stop_codon:yes gene_type:complete